MAAARRARDNALIDALENIQPVSFSGSVWRVVREGRDPLICAASGGRWDDGSFDVLYTSQAADGAVAELFFHLSRGLPVIPSRVAYRLYELTAALSGALRLVDLKAVEALGVDVGRYGALSFADRDREYPRTQDIGETAHFVGFDGLIVPCARWECMNVVLFCDRIAPDRTDVVSDHGPIDWARWPDSPFGF